MQAFIPRLHTPVDRFANRNRLLVVRFGLANTLLIKYARQVFHLVILSSFAFFVPIIVHGSVRGPTMGFDTNGISVRLQYGRCRLLRHVRDSVPL